MSKDPTPTYPVYKEMQQVSGFCPRCACSVGKITIPAEFRKLKCPECGVMHYTAPAVIGRTQACRQCLRVFDDTWPRLEVDDWESIPAPHLCDKCDTELREFQAEVEAGGVSWYCGDCGSSGVFDRESPISKRLREQEHVDPPQGLGVQLQGGCPSCTGDTETSFLDEFLQMQHETEETHGPGPSSETGDHRSDGQSGPKPGTTPEGDHGSAPAEPGGSDA